MATRISASAVYVHQNTLLRDSQIALDSPSESWRLAPATLEALRTLIASDTLLFLYGPEQAAASREGDSPRTSPELRRLAAQVESGGGRVDGLITCTQQSIAAGRCFGDYPGLIWTSVARLNLRPEACYLLGDSAQDALTAQSAGVRPLVILADRSIDQVFGRNEMTRDFPMAVDLTSAASYIQVEEEIAHQIGRAREAAPPAPTALSLLPLAKELPTLTLVSPLAQEMESKLGRNRIQRSEMVRWLFFLTLGAVGLSLGVAYLLTHLYRIQPFPAYVYYVTLQFIPRLWRGAMFILLGATLIAAAMRYLLRRTQFAAWLNGKGQ